MSKITGQWIIDTSDELTMGELEDWVDQFFTARSKGSITVQDHYLEIDMSDSAPGIERHPDSPDHHRTIFIDVGSIPE